MTTGETAALLPVMATDPPTELWSGAVWIGQLDVSEIPDHLSDRGIVLDRGAQFSRARFLIWEAGQPRGFIELDVDEGVVAGAAVRTAVADLPPADVVTDVELPPMSVVVCTRDRPDQLRDMLASIVDSDYPEFEILVVDNGPASGLTKPVVDEFSDRGVRLVDAPVPGLSVARNVAISNARFDIIAFTDDDVVVDHRWLGNLARGFAHGPDVGCVSGLVPTAELIAPAQAYFDRRVGWASSCQRAIYQLDTPPAGDPLFPFRVARFGTGANFAIRRSVARDLGGFDEGMGVGSPTGGGEDIDMFVRVLLGGYRFAFEPGAVIWHRHRATSEGLETQIYNYGLGLGAWMAKLMLRPKTCGMVLRRALSGVSHLRTVTTVADRESDPEPLGLDGLDKLERRGVLAGPMALVRTRLAGRAAFPLRPGGPPRTAAERAAGLSTIASAAGYAGVLGAVALLPSPARVVLVGAFVLLGPGALVLSWYPRLPMNAVVALVPTVGLAVSVLVVSGLLLLGFYAPTPVLLVMAGLTAAGGLLRRSMLARPAGRHTAG
ncbi:MAG: glycosyltransferase [Mycobacterium sp.]